MPHMYQDQMGILRSVCDRKARLSVEISEK